MTLVDDPGVHGQAPFCSFYRPKFPCNRDPWARASKSAGVDPHQRGRSSAGRCRHASTRTPGRTQETATEPASTTAVGAASPQPESAPEAGSVAIAIADAVGASQPSADTGRTSGVAAPRRLHARASDQGFLPIEVEHYVKLLDWTGRELRADKRGAIPDHLAPILERLGLNRSNWVETVRGFGRLFKQAAGRSSSLVDAAARRSRRWFQGKDVIQGCPFQPDKSKVRP
jgi:hypothetical protein